MIPILLFGGIDWSRVDLEDPERFAQNEITVRFREGVEMLENALAIKQASEVRRIEQLNALHLRLPAGADVREALTYYESRPDVLYAEPVAINRAFWVPNDPLFSYQWHFDSDHINMPAAWDSERGSSGVIIGILDTGIAFEDYIIPSYEQGEVSSKDGKYHRAPDFNSSQFVAGYDFIHEDSHPNDQFGHGTHVAGTVAQATNNGIGVAGMAPNCRLMPVQVLTYKGSGPATVTADGIIWAADHGAKVINLSLGGRPGDSTGMTIEHEAIIYAQNKGVVVVAAAGNDEAGQLSYPAGFPECIAVAALDYNNQLAWYSQYGPGLDISAPGGDVGADENDDGYADGVLQNTYLYMGDGTNGARVDTFGYFFLQGTSMATPHVVGLATLLISHGITGVENVKQAIYETATYLGSSGYDTRYGWGMINPLAALNYGGGNNPPNTPAPPSGPSSAAVYESVTFSAQTTDPDGDRVAYQFDWGDGNTSSWTSFVSSGASQSMSHSYSQQGTYTVKAKAKDEEGAFSSWSAGTSISIGGGEVDFAIPVLQNPLLSQYIDIWVVPIKGTLTNPPQATVTLGGEETSVSMNSVSGSEDYVGDYRFPTSGTATIEVFAVGSYKSRTFSVEEIGASGGAFASVDRHVRLEIPKGAVGTSTFFTLIPEQTEPHSSPNPYAIPEIEGARAMGSAYRIGPAGFQLRNPASLRIKYSEAELGGADPATMVIVRYENDAWSEAPSFIDRQRGEVVASLDRLGIFQLVSDPEQSTPDLPKGIELSLATPNPCGAESVLRVSVNKETSLSLAVFDASGRRVRTLLKGKLPAGTHELRWDGKDDDGQMLTSGIYFCILKTPSASQTLKLVRMH